MRLSAEEMLNKYSKSPMHALEVRRLAMIIFDEVDKKLHPLTDRDRSYLEAATLLHDIGYFIESKNHNKHTLQMIIKEGLEGFSDEEVKITACIARYHRGSLPDKHEHEVYKDLDKKERKIVKRLGGILKLADGLDKCPSDLIKNINISTEQKDNIVSITLHCGIFEPDIRPAIRKRDLFELGFKCQSIVLVRE